MSEFERAMWELVRIWLHASYASIDRFGQCHSFLYVWQQICVALGRGYMGRVVTSTEAALVWNALIDAGLPDSEGATRITDRELLGYERA